MQVLIVAQRFVQRCCTNDIVKNIYLIHVLDYKQSWFWSQDDYLSQYYV